MLFTLLLFLLAGSACSGLSENKKLIERVCVEKNVVTIEPSLEVKERFLKNQSFKIVYDESVDLTLIHPSTLEIPFIASISPLIWLSGETFYIETIDEQTQETLQKVKKLFSVFYPAINWSGELIAKNVVPSPVSKSPQEKQALLFSGGLDCISASFALCTQNLLLITNQGVDIPLKNNDMWQEVKKQSTTFAKTYGHSNSFISCNFCTICNYDYIINKIPGCTKWWWLDNVVDVLNHVGITIPLLVYSGVTKLSIAASHTKEFPFPYGSHPLLDNLLRFAGIQVKHIQEDLNRCQKIDFISSATQLQMKPDPYLRVCWSDKQGKNCESCEKCLRTMNNILVMGARPSNFGFNLTQSEVIEKTREFLEKPLKDPKLLWEWSVVKRYAQTASVNTTEDELKSYFSWLSTVNLEKNTTDTIQMIGKRSAFFEWLWDNPPFV